MYKLMIYQHRHGELFPIHMYYSEDKSDLEIRYSYHKQQNETYVGILTTYCPTLAEVL